jgi:hypothetical protein
LPKIVNSLFQTVGLIESEGLISVDEFYAHLGGKVCGETRNRNVCLRRKFSAKLVKRIQLIAATCLFPKKIWISKFFFPPNPSSTFPAGLPDGIFSNRKSQFG